MAASTNEFRRPATVAEDVYLYLRAQLLSGALPGGSWLRETEVATTLDVSRTPVREAIRQLAHEGLVKVEANKGVRVHEPTLAGAIATYEVRERLEAMAARLAAEHADSKTAAVLDARLEAMLRVEEDDFAMHVEADNIFHLSIAELAGNPVLLELVERLNSRVNRVKVLTRHANGTDLAHDQHARIARAIVAGEPETAESLMAEHIRSNLEIVVERLASAIPVMGEGAA